MSDIDDDLLGEWYVPSEDDFLPRRKELEAALSSNRKQRTIKGSELGFNIDSNAKDKVREKIEDIARKSGAKDVQLFIRKLNGFSRLELAAVKIHSKNRNLTKQPNEIKASLSKLGKKARELQEAAIQLDEDTRQAFCQDVVTGLRYVFDGKLDNMAELDLLKFLHLIETVAAMRKREVQKFQRNTPVHFVSRLHTIWTDEVEVGRRGNKGRFIELTKLLLEVTNQPKEDPKYWVKQMQKEYFGRESF